MAASTGLRRSPKPTLSAINTTFTSPAMSHSPSVFSSATISSMASSISPGIAVGLRHPSPRRLEALNSPLLKTDMALPQFSVSSSRSHSGSQFFFDSESPLSENDSPLSSSSDYYCLRQGVPFREQWSNTNDAPTPPPNHTCPAAPPSLAQRTAIKLWESRVSRGTPAPPSPPPAAQFDHHSSKLTISPIEQDIQELSFQINEIHQSLAQSESIFKQGMVSVYMQQNSAAARLAASPTEGLFTETFMFRPSSVDSVSSVEGFQRRTQSARQRSAEARTRAMVAAQEREEQRKEYLKITLVDRIEREVAEIERRAVRDLEMVREARYALRIEIERQKARERRRALEIELAFERERQAALDAQREDEEEAARLIASLNAAAEAIVFSPTERTECEEADESAQECIFHLGADVQTSFYSAPSEYPSSPSLTHSGSTRPSTSHSTDAPPLALSLKCATLPASQFPPALDSASSLKSPYFTFLASPISPCSPNVQAAFNFSSVRSSLNMDIGLGFELGFPDTGIEVNVNEGTTGIAAACA
ncbi:hypothetical protein TWF694_005685 [Orbilia ellipsospora]|uniref:Uncharacterized protein n=1 Tax=Orbilia ellipsospora TaxID=2528407 RepID=A0AAV9WU62_9PEZI